MGYELIILCNTCMVTHTIKQSDPFIPIDLSVGNNTKKEEENHRSFCYTYQLAQLWWGPLWGARLGIRHLKSIVTTPHHSYTSCFSVRTYPAPVHTRPLPASPSPRTEPCRVLLHYCTLTPFCPGFALHAQPNPNPTRLKQTRHPLVWRPAKRGRRLSATPTRVGFPVGDGKHVTLYIGEIRPQPTFFFT
jgi:hypothetical protein